MTTPILMPSIDPAIRSGRLTRWWRREGDFVEAGEPVAEIAAARATMDIEAPHAGVLVRIIEEADGHDIPVESVLGLIDSRVETAAQAEPQPLELEQVEPAPKQPQPVELGRAGRTPISPRARRVAQEFGLDLSGLCGSGPHGRIVESDVHGAMAARAQEDRQPRPPALAPAPQVALEAEMRVDALESLREKLNGTLTDEPARITLADCALKALALALLREGRPGAIALSVTAQGETATHVFEAAATQSLAEIAAARAGLAATGPHASRQASSLVIDFGSYGVLRAFPTLVAPFTTVLALGVADWRVVVEECVPDVALVMNVTLTFDRRAMDEAAGAALLAAFRTVLENPAERLV